MGYEREKDGAIWNHHALERASESKIKTEDLKEAWNRSVEQELSREQKTYKFKKYGMASLRYKYFWDKRIGVLFTVQCKKERWYIRTVTKGRGNFSV